MTNKISEFSFKTLRKKNQVRLTITKKRVSQLKIQTISASTDDISTISKRSISISLPVKKDSNKFRFQLASPEISQEIQTRRYCYAATTSLPSS